MNSHHQLCLQALESKSYDRLYIRRNGSNCWLIITLDGGEHVFVNHNGKTPAYRHAWQIRHWLAQKFGIAQESVPVVQADEPPPLRYSRSQIQQLLQEDIASLTIEFADQSWIAELIPLLQELQSLAAQPKADDQSLANLRERLETVLRRYRLKGLSGYLWMVDSLRLDLP